MGAPDPLAPGPAAVDCVTLVTGHVLRIGEAMDLVAFCALMAGTGFTLVGLWWTVVQKHPDRKSSPRHRALAGGTYVSFLLPGLPASSQCFRGYASGPEWGTLER